MRSHSEIDFLRLLRQTQRVAEQKSWRLEKYVDALGEKLDKLRNQKANPLTRDSLEDYSRKIQYLRGLIETEKLPSAEKRLLAAELLAPDKETKASHLITTNKYYNQIREELLSGSRRRFGSDRIGRNDNEINDVNEDITQNLLELTNNIRENMQAANTIIQKDTEILSKVSGGADLVSAKMQKNTDRLGELVRKGFQCAIWLALVLVTGTFILMVVFIRLFPK